MKTSVRIFMSIFISLILTASFNYRSLAQPVSDPEERSGQDSLRASLSEAQSLTQQGNFEEALEIYTRLLETCPDSKEAVQGWIMANAQHMHWGPDEMSESLARLRETYPANTGILFFKAFIEASTGQNEAALKDIDELIQLQPDTALHYILKGQVLGAQENYIGASEALEIATSLDPSRPDVWGMKAAALAKTGRFDDAIIAINKGFELAPDDPFNMYNRACIYSLKGDKAKALADLEKAISRNASLKSQAVKDEDFKSLYDDEEFKRVTSQL